MPSNQPYSGHGVIQAVLSCCRTFCLQTSIHGFSHIAAPRRHWVERLLWVGILGVAIWGVVDISRGQLQRFLESPTVVTLEKDYRTWRYTLPAVTVCEQNKVNADSLPSTIKLIWNVTPADSTYQYYAGFVSTVADSDLYHLQGYGDFQNDTTLDVDLFQIVLKVSGELVMKTGSSERISPRWAAAVTEAGVCHTINSLATTDSAINMNSTPSSAESLPHTCAYSAQGCYLVIETSRVVRYYIHSPYDTADVALPAGLIFPSLSRFTELTLTETRAGAGVRDLPPARRACRHTDEPTSPGRRVYSTNICRLGCRARLALRLCGCKPFYYFYEGIRQCNASGMWCLAGHAHRLATFDGVRCVCAQQCLDSVFREVSNDDQILERGPLKNRGALRLTVRAPRERYTRDIVFHSQDLVVSFGGAAGLFLGASLISFVELVYFLVEYIFHVNTSKKTRALVKQQSIYTAAEWNRMEASMSPHARNLAPACTWHPQYP
ncbi:acid-sensing ion channel 4-A-like [Aricia agestis]|uniref:acid-sensing ion channel 4-A-like n=1 Tax=Aricia agestis TaxID=91739 RepID=UPI001C205CA5|nr:acid-sensing ion channel 4-A-like [Aricia agestis]